MIKPVFLQYPIYENSVTVGSKSENVEVKGNGILVIKSIQ